MYLLVQGCYWGGVFIGSRNKKILLGKRYNGLPEEDPQEL